MEATIIYLGCIRIMENKVEASILKLIMKHPCA